MHKCFVILYGICLLNTKALCQRVGIGTTDPQAQFAVDSSIMVDQSNTNQGFLDRSALYFGSDKKVGIVRSFLTGSSGRNGMGFFTNNTRRITIDSTGQVGIGTINPLQTLHVNGSSYFSGNIGIGTPAPGYAFDNQYGYNYMFYGLGIGTAPNSTYKLDVGSGPSRFQTDVRMDGILNPNNTLNIGNNANVEGSLTVNAGKGIVRSSNTNQLKVYMGSASVNAVLPGFGTSAEFSIAWPTGIFSSPPTVLVGDITSSGGSLGQLWRVQMITYFATANNCKAVLINTHPNAVNYTITWNYICIGD